MVQRYKRLEYSTGLFFLIWPFGLFVKSLFNLRNSSSKNGIWLFTIFLGLSLVVVSEGIDAYRYAQEFRYFAAENRGFAEIFKNLYIKSYALDIFKPIIIFLVSSFTDNPSIFFACVAVVYGFLFSRNLAFIISKVEGRFLKYQVLVLYAFMFIVAIQDFQFVRFTTAAHLFLFGTLPFLYVRNRKYLLWAALSVLVHFSFIFPVAILFIYIFLPKNIHVLFAFYIVSIFFVQLKLESINNILILYAPDLLQDKVTTYGNEDYAQLVNQNFSATHWYIQYHGAILDFVIVVFFILIYHTAKKTLKDNQPLIWLFGFALLMTGIANLISVFPSGVRFISVSRLFSVAFIIIMIGYIKHKAWFSFFRIVTMPALVIYIIIGLRFFVDVFGFSAIFSNPILVLIFPDKELIIDVIKSIV